MSNPFVWFDHRSDDPAAATSFYEQLLAWKESPQSPPGMTAFGSDAPWAGVTAGEGLPTGWRPYVQVDDLASSVRHATKLGAQVVKDTTQGPAGTFAVVRDPAGGAIALWQAA